MGTTTKPLEELDLMDDFLINAVTTNEEVAEPFCQTVLLQRKISKLRIVAQRTIPALEPDKRGIRMDVEIEEYSDEGGERDFSKMPDLFVLTITNFDPFDYEYISKVKVSEEARVEYMKYDDLMYYAKKDGRAEAVIEILEDLESVPEDVRNTILSQRNMDILKQWLKCAAKAKSLEEWKQMVNWVQK